VTYDLQIILVSPSAHYPTHNWPNTVALMRALRQKGCNVQAVTFSTATEPAPPELSNSVEPVFARLPWGWRHVAKGQWQDRHFGALMNSGETIACMLKALRQKRRQSALVLHFIGGSYWMVVLATLYFKRVHFVYSLYGGILAGSASGLKARLRPHLRNLLQRAAATERIDFICENELLYEEIKPLLGAHIHVVPYAVDESESLPSREEARRRLDLPLAEKILLFFGTHRREKDYHTALKGCLTLLQPPLALFVGKVISSNDPRRVVADCGYTNARIINDFVQEEAMKYYFAAADAVVLPYEANFSRGSGVLIECCRHLRPMIVSATPYFSAFLTRYPCGIGYAPGDSTSFAEAAGHLLADSGVYQAALAQARHDHSWTAAGEQYIKLYQR
jgi:glycosyltransferase involved in cell wall biosynthesis